MPELIPLYSVAHKGGEDDEAYYSVSRLIEIRDGDEVYESVAKDVSSEVARECVHSDAKSRGYELYCITGFPSDRYFTKGGVFVGHQPPKVDHKGASHGN